MTDIKIKPISSLAAPTKADLALWQALSAEEREAVLRDKAARAASSPARAISIDEFLADAKSRLTHG